MEGTGVVPPYHQIIHDITNREEEGLAGVIPPMIFVLKNVMHISR